MHRWMTIALLTVALAGCAKPTLWQNLNVSGDQAQRDLYECERDARMSLMSFGGGVLGEIEAKRFFERCMFSKGYNPVQGE